METQGKLLTREEFEEDMKIQKECYETLCKYNDFKQWKEYFRFEIISYEQYLERYETYYNEAQEGTCPLEPLSDPSGNEEENKIITNTIDEE